MTSFLAVAALDGEVLSEAVLDAREMCYMNFAREEHKKLEKILLTLVIPAMGGYDNELACDIARHLEQIQSFSGNYCWRHRHLGASHGIVGQPAADGGLV
ncbi:MULTISPECIES: hypothetical protein [unclassified Pseudomonas]|uniref:hypothetical protein n=1 Tax=unclassified Pseudomonas TaxID=196821 RepID=UPI000DE7B702|nr:MULTISPECIES: hypothetical protein [unclassified Pseudomonas]PWB33756.1 hypothetical protein DCO48_08860 [Pseudomonas sp. SDI]UVL50521.1 hypothetical protein LOY33_21515 [Pseudomonas sp. B21-036]